MVLQQDQAMSAYRNPVWQAGSQLPGVLSSSHPSAFGYGL